MFKVYRGDAYSYETDDLEVVLTEDNSDWRRVTRLDFLVQVDSLRLVLTFSNEDGAEINIEGSDRDQVFLLFSDAREYLQEEVNLSRISAPLLRRIEMMLPMLLLMVFLIAILVFLLTSVAAQLPSPGEAESVLASSDLRAKLDFLVKRYLATRPTAASMWLLISGFFLWLLLLPLSLSGFPARAIGAVFPANVFIFGTQKARFERRRRLVTNIVWVIIVGLLVSFIGGMLVWFITG